MKLLKSVEFIIPVNVGSGVGPLSSINTAGSGVQKKPICFYEDDDGYIIIEAPEGNRRIPPTNVKYMVLLPAAPVPAEGSKK